jgi:Asp-tRNAAsn/Glu-tRNAGln amidotransferase A subunit and related amidases
MSAGRTSASAEARTLGAVKAAAAMRAGRLSAHAYAEQWLARIAAREAEVRAWIDFDAERAMKLADACDATRESGVELGLLHGVPIGVKDILATADLPTQMGSVLYAGHRPERDAVVVQRLRNAGAYVMGKTVTTEFAFMHPGPTRNPWNPAHTPGGSSSGSAAAVAAGFVPLAIGTQTNGSIIRPAAYCGVVGFKPTAGTVPGGGCFVYSETLDQIGLFAHDVADAALFAAVLTDDEQLLEYERVRARAPRFAALANFPWNSTQPEAARHFDATLDRLRACGATIETLVLPPLVGEAQAAHRTIMFYEAARQHAHARTDERDALSAALCAALDEGAAIPGERYRAALAVRAAIMEQMNDLFADCDAILSPSASGPAPAGLHATGDPSFATLWSLTGAPAISVPDGWSSDGLPFGLQIAASGGADALLLSVARWCESGMAAPLNPA